MSDSGTPKLLERIRKGIECKIVGGIEGVYRIGTYLQLKTVQKAIWLFWRSSPEPIGAEIFFLKDVTCDEVLKQLVLYFVDMKVTLEMPQGQDQDVHARRVPQGRAGLGDGP